MITSQSNSTFDLNTVDPSLHTSIAAPLQPSPPSILHIHTAPTTPSPPAKPCFCGISLSPDSNYDLTPLNSTHPLDSNTLPKGLDDIPPGVKQMEDGTWILWEDQISDISLADPKNNGVSTSTHYWVFKNGFRP